jgi:hypothetical protein
VKAISFILLLLVSNSVFAKKLRDYTPYKYEVLFTNPVCKEYKYSSPLKSNSGKLVYGKTKNSYCKSSDSSVSGRRKNSPHYRLIEWIKDPSTTEIFMAYLSFSKRSIAKELCKAVEQRNVKITLVMDSNNLPEDGDNSNGRMSTAYYLKKCRPKNLTEGETPNLPRVYTRGGTGRGRNKTGYAHNKLFFVNPSSATATKIVFSSGNMSSGTVTHHENWNFVTTSSETYFAQSHKCLMKGMISHSQDIATYTNFINTCQSKIKIAPESDISVYFIPGDGTDAYKQIKTAINTSKSVDLISHRFSNSTIIENLTTKLEDTRKPKVRFIGDDDLYWTSVYRKGMGRNTTFEWYKIRDLINVGMDTKYIETYADDVFEPKSMQLQHNKFLIFHFDKKGAVFTGAGNLTISAFKQNFENFYYITIPEVYDAFANQYNYLWFKLGKSHSELPTKLELP